jgi:hypothetical protein
VRRLLVSAALVPVLVFALAGQALAVIAPGTEKMLSTTNQTCDSTGCVRTQVQVNTYVDGTAEVHASQTFFDPSNNSVWEYWGVSPVDPSTLTYDSRGFIVGIPTTSIDQVDLIGSGLPRTVSVSAAAHESGRVRSATYKTQETDGACINNVTQKNQAVVAAGTLTQDAATFSANYNSWTTITEWTVRRQCPH